MQWLLAGINHHITLSAASVSKVVKVATPKTEERAVGDKISEQSP
jgi:hypothetical protein